MFTPPKKDSFCFIENRKPIKLVGFSYIYQKLKIMIKNILAVILGLVIGSALNMGLIILGAEIFPLKEGFDPMNAMNWELKYFIFPFFVSKLFVIF